MIDFLIVLLVFLWGSTLMSALILVRHRQHPACRQFAWAVENDSDIKIAPDFSSKSSLPRLEPSEEEILLYFKHKQCCNLEKARCLGQQLGTQILCLPQDLAQEQLTLEPPLLLHAQDALSVCQRGVCPQTAAGPHPAQTGACTDERHHLRAAAQLLQQSASVSRLHRL